MQNKNTDAELVRFVRTHRAKIAGALSQADDEELAGALLNLTDEQADAELVRFAHIHGAKIAVALSKAGDEELALALLKLLKLLGNLGTMDTKVTAEKELRKRLN